MDHVQQLKKILEVSGFTQLALAEQIGVSHISLNAWINGRAIPRRGALRTIDQLYVDLVMEQESFADRVGRLSDEQINALLRGAGDAEVISVLRDGQYRSLLSRLEAILCLLPEAQAQAIQELLAAAQYKNGDTYNAALMYPHIGVWSMTCLRALIESPQDEEITRHIQYLATVAAVVAWKCGVKDFAIDVAVNDVSLVLPSIGRVTFDEEADRVQVQCNGGLLSIVAGDSIVRLPEDVTRSVYQWQPIHTLVVTASGLTLTLVIDDIDPYRATNSTLAHATPAARLEQLDYKTWIEQLTDAWILLAEHYAEYAAGFAAGISVIVPLEDPSRWQTAFYRDGFGAVLSTIAPSSEAMAQGLLEEFQRMKIRALHASTPLYNGVEAEAAVYYAPWAAGPVTLGGLVEGFYSVAATLEFSRARYKSAIGERRSEWAVHFRIRKSWGESIFQRLLGVHQLTELGTKMLQAAHEASAAITESLPPEVMKFARGLAIDRWMCFRMGYIVSRSLDVERLAQAWIAGLSCPIDPLVSQSLADVPEQLYGWKTRRSLGELRLAHPETFSEMLDNQHYLDLVVPGSTTTDAYATEELFAEAAHRYIAVITGDCSDGEAWAALATVLAREGGEAISTFCRFPEIVADLYRYLDNHCDTVVDPLQLARWLEPLFLRMDHFAYESQDAA